MEIKQQIDFSCKCKKYTKCVDISVSQRHKAVNFRQTGTLKSKVNSDYTFSTIQSCRLGIHQETSVIQCFTILLRYGFSSKFVCMQQENCKKATKHRVSLLTATITSKQHR